MDLYCQCDLRALQCGPTTRNLTTPWKQAGILLCPSTFKKLFNVLAQMDSMCLYDMPCTSKLLFYVAGVKHLSSPVMFLA